MFDQNIKTFVKMNVFSIVSIHLKDTIQQSTLLEVSSYTYETVSHRKT